MNRYIYSRAWCVSAIKYKPTCKFSKLYQTESANACEFSFSYMCMLMWASRVGARAMDNIIIARKVWKIWNLKLMKQFIIFKLGLTYTHSDQATLPFRDVAHRHQSVSTSLAATEAAVSCTRKMYMETDVKKVYESLKRFWFERHAK